MGEAIDQSSFEPEDYAVFRRRLQGELETLGELVRRPEFGAGEPSIGAEVEMALVGADMRPARVNRAVLTALGDHAGPDGLAPELDRFSIEIDTPPGPLAGASFADMEQAIQAGFDRIGAAAGELGCQPLLIGTLPTVTLDDLTPSEALTPEARYVALAAGLSRHRADDLLDIVGQEQLRTEVPGVAAEGIMSALQVHLKVPPERFAATLNAAHLASAPVLGAAGNSPFVLGRSLWAETRISLFRQVVDGSGQPPGHPSRAALGHGWLRGSPIDLFVEDAGMHAPLLPVRFDDAAPGAGTTTDLPAIRLHGGTVWRWNRPVFDATGDGHIRMELRCLPSGPTVADMVANAAFLLGATLALAENEDLPATMPFAAARENLDAAARDGLDAMILWPAGESPSPVLRPLGDVAAELVPLAAGALAAAGVQPDDAQPRLEIIRRRLERRCTGTTWQRQAVAAREARIGRDAATVEMLRTFGELSLDGAPVADWLPGAAR